MKIERILNQLRGIAVGVARKIYPNKRYTMFYAIRKYECVRCDHKVSTLGFDKCGICGCLLSLKIKSTTKTNDCPLGKWIRLKHFGSFKYENKRSTMLKDTNTGILECSLLIRKLEKRERRLNTEARKTPSLCDYKKIYELDYLGRELETLRNILGLLREFKSEISDNVKKNS